MPWTRDREVQAADVRHAPTARAAEHARSPPRASRRRAADARAREMYFAEQQAADAHAAHERAEQHAHRHRRRADDETEELEPDDLVDQRRAAAADEQQHEQRKKAILHGRAAGAAGTRAGVERLHAARRLDGVRHGNGGVGGRRWRGTSGCKAGECRLRNRLLLEEEAVANGRRKAGSKIHDGPARSIAPARRQ